MLRKMYSRIIIVSFSIVIVLMLITGTVLFSILSNFFVTDKGERLREEAARINDMTFFYVNKNSGDFKDFYFKALNDTADRMNGVICIYDRYGHIISSDNIASHYKGAADFEKIDKSVFEGNEIIDIGDFGGMLSGVYLTVGVPLYIENKVACATFVSVPVPEVNKYRSYVINIFSVTIFITFTLSLICSVLYSRRVTMPIMQMNKISKEIAGGNFTGRVDAKGKSDVAELADNFNKMADSLKNLEDMRSSFISNVSHELRTPMTTISGFVEGILDNTISEEDREKYLKIVLDETKRLARLVGELLEMSRIDSGKTNITMKKFNINELIRISVIRFENQISGKNIDVEIDFECEQEFVIGDKDAISRVLTNLIDNAIKFNFSGGYIKIKVFGWKNSKIKIMIENSGIGMNDEELRRVFERFYKSDKSRSYDKNGMGIGLYLVNNIISSHGESIVAESEKDKWARFTFTLKKA